MKPTWGASYNNRADGAVCLLYALGRTAIRHTQQQRLGGMTVCELPEKTEETIAGTFKVLGRNLAFKRKSILP